jgi:hypothetical protein
MGRYVVAGLVVLHVMLLAGCMAYFRGERYSCFNLQGVDKCKQPPYHYPPPATAPLPEPPNAPGEVY